jgi:DNA-binding XRE family transcriptional regulator
MNQRALDNYLHTHRKKAGLSQREVGNLLGYSDEFAVSRHERSKTLPPLLIAIGYEVVFKKPIATLFPGLKEAVDKTIELRMRRFEEELQKENGKSRRGSRIAQKRAWLNERRKFNESSMNDQ